MGNFIVFRFTRAHFFEVIIGKIVTLRKDRPLVWSFMDRGLPESKRTFETHVVGFLFYCVKAYIHMNVLFGRELGPTVCLTFLS